MNALLRYLLCGFLVACTPLLHAAGLVIVQDGSGSESEQRILPVPDPRPPVSVPMGRRFSFATLQVTSLHADVQIKDQVATTTFNEEFYNPNPRAIEGTFLFPLPRGAHIEKFALQIGDTMIEAELLDSEKARRLYEDIVRRAKDPALLEYDGREVLKARIFPFEAHGRKQVRLTYTELLRADSGMVTYTFPLSGTKYSAAAVKNLSVMVDLASTPPLKSIYSPSHNIEIRRHGPKHATIGFEALNQKSDLDFQLLFSREEDELGFNLLTQPGERGDGYFLLLASPGLNDSQRKPLPKDVAFVLDTSGSMAGPKLEQAKKALLFCVENLNDDDRFEIIRFSTETEALFSQLRDASADNRSRARKFVQRLKTIGGTAIDDALRQALELRPDGNSRPFIVVFLTDGRPTVGVTDEEQIVGHVTHRAVGEGNPTRIFCFGIGTDVNTHLLDRIAEHTRAFTQYVLPEEDIEVKVSNFFAKINQPVLTNLKLRTSGGVRLSSMYPRELPDLFQGEQLVIAGRYSGTGSCSFDLTGNAGPENKHFSFVAQFASEGSDRPFIPRLWATRRVGFLLEEIRLHGENQELRQEVTELARQYGIVTPYTAYLILEDETRRNVPVALQSLPALHKDEAAQEVARDYFSTANRAKSGDVAVAGARYGLALRLAENEQSLQLSQVEAQRGLSATAPVAAAPMGRSPSLVAPSAPEQTKARLSTYAQQNQFVGGRNFFLNGTQWVDGTVQNQSGAKHVRIQFNSPDYFALAKKEPRVAPWLALGPNVQFVLRDTIYEIVD